MIKLKPLITEGKFKTADQLQQGDVIRRNLGYGIGTYVVNKVMKQSRSYKNEWDVLVTVLVPGKVKGGGKYNEKYGELHATFQPKYGKFTSKIEYLGTWDQLKDKYTD